MEEKKETLIEKLYWFWKLKFVDKYYDIKYWLKHHFKKRFYNVLKTVLKSYPWDYSFLYEIEEAKLKEMLNYHENSHIVCEESREQMIRTIKWALSMLYIIQHDTDFYHFTGEAKFNELDETDKNGESLYEWDGSDLEYHCDINVNTRNYKRFKVLKSVIDLHKHELYIEKARYLYHKIRLYYEQYWWD